MAPYIRRERGSAIDDIECYLNCISLDLLAFISCMYLYVTFRIVYVTASNISLMTFKLGIEMYAAVVTEFRGHWLPLDFLNFNSGSVFLA